MDEGFRAGRVEIDAPARLHLGFLDLEGGLGRRFGSVGLAIDGIATRIALTPSAAIEITGPSAARARIALERAAELLGVEPLARLVVDSAIPEHVGLGSGTQLGLAVAAGFARLHGSTAALPALAAAVERGARSGIGIGAFAEGGLLVDGGRGPADARAPIVARTAFPEDWPILLLLDEQKRGLHGTAETAAFRALPRFSEALAGQLCRLVLMQLLPGLAERDFAAVSAALGEMQARLGDYFAPAQGGRFTSPAVADAAALLRERGVVGVGQSSWGPTGFALCRTPAEAERLAQAVAARGGDRLTVKIVAARNCGAEIQLTPTDRSSR